MAFLSIRNNAFTTLAFDITAVATSLTVATGEGARFPTSNFHISIGNEILLCTARTGDVFTITRAREGTTASAHTTGARVVLRVTAGIVEEMRRAIGSISVSFWATRVSAVDNEWFFVTWSPELGLFVAVAASGTGNRVMTSPDGIAWTIRTSAADNSWRSVTWSPQLGLFVAVAQSGTGNRVMTSLRLN